MQTLFEVMQDAIDERMVQIARMSAMNSKDQLKALQEMARKTDVPSTVCTVAPMWRGVQCTEVETMSLSIWQAMVQVHRSSGSSMVDCKLKIQFDLFYDKVRPTVK